MLSKDTLIATNRFGLGPSRADIAKASSNPKAWLLQQIDADAVKTRDVRAQYKSAFLLNEADEIRLLKSKEAKKQRRKSVNAQYSKTMDARLLNQIETASPFAERMVMFWSNHFTVSRTRGLIGSAIPAYEDEAIRPFIFGRFEDLLINVVQHPCMLIYLDNISSIGPNSRLGKRRNKDLNENLAREILELHTMGSQGGYSQNDVTNFAKILTGWTVGRARRNAKAPKKAGKNVPQPPLGEFYFNGAIHEPGAQILLKKRFDQTGHAQGLAALKAIAAHPSTAKFIATKLVRHFVDDNPPKADIDKIAGIFLRSKGDLAAVSRGVIGLKSAWAMSGSKVKTPEELVISTLRALYQGGKASAPKKRLFLPALKSMGQEVFRAPSPAGWPDIAKGWIAPESLMRRIEWVREVSRLSSADIRPLDIFDNSIAPIASKQTKAIISGAPSREDGLALIFSSAAFQRR